MKKTFIYIPQKFYGFITPDSEDHIEALFTNGINTCVGITLNTIGGGEPPYVFLCHADAFTDLADKIHGIPGWIKQIPQAYTRVYIEYDNDNDDDDLRKLLDSIARDEKFSGRNVQIARNQQNLASVAITRAGKIIHSGELSAVDLRDYVIAPSNADFEVVLAKDFDIAYRVHDLVENIQVPSPPIQACDKHGLLTLEQILLQRPDLISAFKAAHVEERVTPLESEHLQGPRPG